MMNPKRRKTSETLELEIELVNQQWKTKSSFYTGSCGPGRIRTGDQQIMSLALYLAELRAPICMGYAVFV